jgi:hypothetical protein
MSPSFIKDKKEFSVHMLQHTGNPLGHFVVQLSVDMEVDSVPNRKEM